MGLSGNILVKSHIPKSEFDNFFDIREDYDRRRGEGRGGEGRGDEGRGGEMRGG